MSAKDSESSNSKNSADVKDLTIADSEKVQFANDDSGEIMSAKVENEDNSVNYVTLDTAPERRRSYLVQLCRNLC